MSLALKWLLSPVWVAQALATRRQVPRMPEADGPREGRLGPIGEPLRLLIAGDSSAAGVGVGHQDEAFAGHFTRALQTLTGRPLAWQLCARSGLNTQALHAWLRTAPPRPADLAVVFSGVNDVVDQVPVRAALAHRAQLTGWLLREGLAASIVYAPLPPIERFAALRKPLSRVLGADAGRHNRAIAAWVARQPQVYFPRFALDLSGRSMARDGFHPGEPLYRECASIMAQFAVDHVLNPESTS